MRKRSWIDGVWNNKVGYSHDRMDKMSAQHTNPVFVPEENYNERSFSPPRKEQGSISKKDVFTIDVKNNSKSKEAEEDYDPYLHRKVNHPTTTSETLFHLLKGALGTGILAMPKAFSNSGYLLGMVGTLFIGFTCTYCVHLLLNSHYELCKRKKTPSLTYPAIAEAALAEGPVPLRKFASYSPVVVNTFLLIYQLGTCCVYVVFIAANIQSVGNLYIAELSIEIYMLMFLIPLILLNWIKNLKRLAPFSTAANIMTMISFGIIFYYVIRDFPNFENREVVGKVENMPLFFGTVLFALEAIGVIMPLENEMKTPKSFGSPVGVLNIGMTVVILLYLGTGLLGYLTYGNEVFGTITLNLPKNDVLAQAVKLILALSIFITYALQCYVAVDITWNEYLGPRLEKNSKQVVWEYVTRTVIVLFTVALAAAVPALDLFISLFGAFCLSALGIAIPAAIETCTYWHSREGTWFYIMLIKNVMLIVLGMLGLIAGTYSSLRDIVKEFS